MTYYDRQADVLLVEVSEEDADRSEEREWGLVDLAEDGHTVAVEVWRASTRLPSEVLATLPPPPVRSAPAPPPVTPNIGLPERRGRRL
jgi:uncharacterized protein YuzE